MRLPFYTRFRRAVGFICVPICRRLGLVSEENDLFLDEKSQHVFDPEKAEDEFSRILSKTHPLQPERKSNLMRFMVSRWTSPWIRRSLFLTTRVHTKLAFNSFRARTEIYLPTMVDYNRNLSDYTCTHLGYASEDFATFDPETEYYIRIDDEDVLDWIRYSCTGSVTLEVFVSTTVDSNESHISIELRFTNSNDALLFKMAFFDLYTKGLVK